MSLKGIPASHCHVIKELASLSGLHITEYWGYNTFIHHSPGNLGWQEWVFKNIFMTSVQHSSIVFCDRWVQLENMIFISLISVHNCCSLLLRWQEAVKPANFRPWWVPCWACGQTWLTEEARRASTTWEPASAICHTTVCDGWEGTARVLDAVWWAVWAEDGLHPPRVQTDRSTTCSVAGSDVQDELCGFTPLLSHQPSEPGHH